MKISLEGPINKCSDAECKNWRNEVIKKLGDDFTFHNPMDLDCRGKEKEMEQTLVNFDTFGIASSDIILVMAEKPGWGTAMAVQMAWAMHKTIISICSSAFPNPWLKNRSTHIVFNIDEAIEKIFHVGKSPTDRE